MILKEYKKEFAIYAGLVGGAIILLISFGTIENIIGLLERISKNTSYNSEFVNLLLKITGVSILIEYAVSVCKDAGEASIGSKIDFAGKVLIISMSIPVISLTLSTLFELLP